MKGTNTLLTGLLTLGTFSLTLAVPTLAYATTFTVNSTVDAPNINPSNGLCITAAGSCTLRAAIEASNAVVGFPPPQINLPAGTYKLTLGELKIQTSLFLNGENPLSTVIDGNGKSRMFSITDTGTQPIANISNVTIRNGIDPGGTGTAGAILISQRSSLVLTDSIVNNNKSNIYGGAIRNQGFLQIFGSTIANNEITGDPYGGGLTATGGGILNAGTLEINKSTISSNKSTRGGGIANIGGKVSIINSTISGNIASTRGGGIYNSGAFRYENGEFKLDTYGTVDISYSTLSENQANVIRRDDPNQEDTFGGGIYNNSGGIVSIGNSILAGNTDNRSRFEKNYSPDCFSKTASDVTSSDRYFTSFRGNLVGVINSNCAFKDTIYGDTRFDQVGTPDNPLDPRLGPLANNGGLTRTYSLLSDSPAIDKGNGITSASFFNCPSTDQRGAARPFNGICDVGAFEFGATFNP